jgi:hypothetical protein
VLAPASIASRHAQANATLPLRRNVEAARASVTFEPRARKSLTFIGAAHIFELSGLSLHLSASFPFRVSQGFTQRLMQAAQAPKSQPPEDRASGAGL